MKKLLAIPLIVFCGTQAQAQIAWTGLKAGYNLSWLRYDKPAFRDQHRVTPVSGYHAGLASTFKMKDRYFLHTELIFSTKGRIVEGPGLLHDHTVYHHIDLPIMYNIHFNGRLKLRGVRYFKWYTGIGPNLSYWLGGHGTIRHSEVTEFEREFVNYQIKFAPREEEHLSDANYVYFENPNRIQLGVNFGGGVILEPRPRHKFIIDLRFELGHSWLTPPGGSKDVVVPASWKEDLRARHLGGRASMIYMLEYSLDRKAGRKGQSTKKREIKKRR